MISYCHIEKSMYSISDRHRELGDSHLSCYEFASDNIWLIKILENIYYNQVCQLACKILKIFFLQKTISGVDILEVIVTRIMDIIC